MSALFADCVRCREPHGMLLYGELTRHCNRCAHEVVEARGESIRALTANLATAIAERDAARRALGEMWSAAWLLMWRAIGDSISADDWCNEWARCPSPEAFAEVTRERDALKAGKWAGAWEAMPPTLRWARFGSAGVKAEVGPGDAGWWHWTDSGGQDRDDSLDAAKAAADAHLVAAGWYLEGGPHGAGEAK